ncbi:MAG: glycosyltransferase [Myxococcota bacterium]
MPTTRPEPPLVSLIMPTFDRPEWLARSLGSALAQTHERLEVIVVNDGGADVSDVIARVDRAGRVTSIRCPQRRGPSGARNVGLALARGDYLGFLDDDDTLDPHHVATLVAELGRGAHEVAYASTRRILQERRGDTWVTLGVEDPVPDWARAHAPDELLVHNPLPILAPLFSRRVYETIGGFDETLPVLEDWELWIRMSRQFPMVHVPVVTSTVHVRADGITHTRRRDFFTSAQRIFARYPGPRPEIAQAQAQLVAGHRRHLERPPAASVIVAAHPGQDPADVDACVTAILERTRGATFELLVAAPFAPPRDYEAPQLNWHHTERAETPAVAVDALVEIAAAPFAAVVDARARVRLGWLAPLLSAAEAGAVAVGGQSIDPASGTLLHVGLEVGQGGTRLRAPFAGGGPHQTTADDATGLAAVAGGVTLFNRAAWSQAGGLSGTGPLAGRLTDALAALCFAMAGPVAFAPASQCSWAVRPAFDPEALLARYRAPAGAQSDDEVATARQLARETRMDEARAILDRRLTTTPTDGEALLVRALVGAHQGRRDEAFRDLRAARAAGAERFATTMGELMLLVAEGRHQEAAPLSLAALDRYPLEPEALHFAFATGLATGETAPVAERFERYLTHRPDDAHARFSLASLYVGAGEFLRARTHTEALAARAPNYPDLHVLRERLETATPTRAPAALSPAAALTSGALNPAAALTPAAE